MAKRTQKPGRSAKPSTDVEMCTDPITSITLPTAQIVNGTDDPMSDPADPNADEEELFEPDLSDIELASGDDDEEASNISADEEEAALDLDDDDDDEDMDEDGGAPLTTRESLSPSAVPLIGVNGAGGKSETTTTAITDASSILDSTIPASLHVEKPVPYTYDAGHLLINDANPLPPTNAGNQEAIYTSTARDAAQSLLNHLLTTCPIHTLSTTSTSSSGVEMTLPPPIYHLPREKRVPEPKPPTKWELFAKKKGIGAKNAKGGVQGRDGNMEYDKETGEWVPRHGYKGRNKKGENDWLVEVDEEAEKKAADKDGGAAGGLNPRTMKRAERVEKVRRNDRARRANETRARRGGAKK